MDAGDEGCGACPSGVLPSEPLGEGAGESAGGNALAGTDPGQL